MHQLQNSFTQKVSYPVVLLFFIQSILLVHTVILWVPAGFAVYVLGLYWSNYYDFSNIYSSSEKR